MAEQVRLLWKPFFYWRILAIQSNLVSLHWQSISTFLTKFNLNAEVIKLAAKKQLFSRTHESWYHDCPMRHRRCLSTIVFSMKFVSSIKSNSTDSTFIQYNMVIKIDQIGNYYSELRPMINGSWGIHGTPRSEIVREFVILFLSCTNQFQSGDPEVTITQWNSAFFFCIRSRHVTGPCI